MLTHSIRPFFLRMPLGFPGQIRGAKLEVAEMENKMLQGKGKAFSNPPSDSQVAEYLFEKGFNHTLTNSRL